MIVYRDGLRLDRFSSVEAVRKRLRVLEIGERNLREFRQEVNQDLSSLYKTDGVESDVLLSYLLFRSWAVGRGLKRVRYEKGQIMERHPIRSRIAGFLNCFL